MLVNKKTRSKTCDRIDKKEKRLLSLFARKRAMSIAVVFLVLATLVLTIFSLFVFLTRANNLSKTIELASLDEVYVKEELINFYINEIMGKAVEKTKGSDNFEEDFPTNFLIELDKYKTNNDFIMPELEQIQNQFNENSDLFLFENGKATAEFEIKITEIGEPFSAVYTYKKRFEKQL